MPGINSQLVHSPEADQFFEVMGTATGRQAFLGDPTKYHADVYNHISVRTQPSKMRSRPLGALWSIGPATMF